MAKSWASFSVNTGLMSNAKPGEVLPPTTFNELMQLLPQRMVKFYGRSSMPCVIVNRTDTISWILKWCGKPFAKTKSTIRACCSISPPTIDLHKQVKVLASCIADAKISSEC